MTTSFPEFMNAKLVAEYLDLNEKKVYALANDGLLPATKVTGKWLFPKAMLDKWLLESCHNGVLNDRLLIAGSDDPLLQMIVAIWPISWVVLLLWVIRQQVPARLVDAKQGTCGYVCNSLGPC